MFEKLKEERAFWKRLRRFPNEVWGCKSGLEPLEIRMLTVFFDSEKKEIVFSIMQEKTLDTIIRTLSFQQIEAAECYVEQATISRNKSPISRAVVGGVLAGGAGAVVGAISGTGEKKQTVYISHLVLSYRSSAGEKKEIDLVQNSLTKPSESKFIKAVLERFNAKQYSSLNKSISKYERL